MDQQYNAATQLVSHPLLYAVTVTRDHYATKDLAYTAGRDYEGWYFGVAVSLEGCPPLFSSVQHVLYGSAEEAERYAHVEALKEFSRRMARLLGDDVVVIHAGPDQPKDVKAWATSNGKRVGHATGANGPAI